MDYIISEDRLIRLIDKYMNESFGELKEIPSEHVNAREGDFDLVSNDGRIMFSYLDYNLAIYTNLYYTLMGLFNLSGIQIERIFELWFKKHYPNSLLLSVYCSIY
jgi:hypothetical protein